MYCPRATTPVHSSWPDLFDLPTHQRIQPHPLNLPARGGETPETVGVVGEVKGKDIRGGCWRHTQVCSRRAA
jgi:hypothetical protein